MPRADYAGGAHYAPAQDPTTIPSGADMATARDARRAILFRLPVGRALDNDDLLSMLDEGNQTSRAIVLRRRLLDHVREHLPSGVLVTEAELEQAHAAEEHDPGAHRHQLHMAPWPVKT